MNAVIKVLLVVIEYTLVAKQYCFTFPLVLFVTYCYCEPDCNWSMEKVASSCV